MGEWRNDVEDRTSRCPVDEDGERKGPKPSDQELWAYYLGEMTPDQEVRFAERLSRHPESAQLLIELVDGCEGLLDSGEDLSEAEVEAAWRRWRREHREREKRKNRS